MTIEGGTLRLPEDVRTRSARRGLWAMLAVLRGGSAYRFVDGHFGLWLFAGGPSTAHKIVPELVLRRITLVEYHSPTGESHDPHTSASHLRADRAARRRRHAGKRRTRRRRNSGSAARRGEAPIEFGRSAACRLRHRMRRVGRAASVPRRAGEFGCPASSGVK